MKTLFNTLAKFAVLIIGLNGITAATTFLTINTLSYTIDYAIFNHKIICTLVYIVYLFIFTYIAVTEILETENKSIKKD